jgi:hypothetical protein
MDRMRKTYFDSQSKRNILPLNEQQTRVLDSNNGRPDAAFIQALYRDLRSEIEDEFLRYCDDRIHEYEIDSIDDFLSKSTDELTLLFNEENEGTRVGHDDDDMGTLFDPDIEALAANKDGTGKPTKKHYTELFQLINDAAIGRFNERFYYFYAYLTHWVEEKKSPYLDQDFLFCIDVSRLKEIANDTMLQAKVRYILEAYFESTISSNTLTCRLDLTNAELQMRILRSLQKFLAANVNDLTALEEARSNLVKDKLVYFYAGFKAYLFRMNLSKTHPSRLARLQDQLNTYQQQQQRTNKSAKTTTRSSASTVNKNSRKVVTVMSKHHPAAPSTPVDLTTMTKTQHLLNERNKTFEQIQPNQIEDLLFPNTNTNKTTTTRQRSAANTKSRSSHNRELETSNSEKEKTRGPILVQYTLTTGLKVKYSDGRPATEGSANGTSISLQQPRDGMAHSFDGTND